MSSDVHYERLRLPMREWLNSYAGFMGCDEGAHWVLYLWGRPICWGTEDEIGAAQRFWIDSMAAQLETALPALEARR